jgi:hypothetical protein
MSIPANMRALLRLLLASDALTLALRGSGALALAFLASTARADLTPDWVSTLPLGTSLAAGVWGMVVDAAGVTYVTMTMEPSTNLDIVTAAFRPDGSLLWSRTYNGPANWHDQARALALGPGGVLYVAGNTPDPLSFANVLLLKYDAATGTLLHVVQYSSGPGTSEYGGSVATDAQGNVYVGGGTVGDGSDGMILKFDAAGQLLWKRTWDGPALAPYSQDSILEIVMDPNDVPVALIHGVMASNHPDYVVVKYAPSDGSTIWEANWGVSGEDAPRDMQIDSSGDIYVTGTGINMTNRFSTIKLRGTDGQLLWQAYDSAGADDAAAALALDGQGGVYVTGSVDPDGNLSNFNDNIYTVKRDASTGAFLWSHLYGANCLGCYDVPSDVIVDPAGHVFVAGRTSSPPYSADAITLVLDAGTGAETVRGIVPSGSGQSAEGGFLRFDSAYNLLDAGETYGLNTGGIELLLFKYDALAGAPTLLCEPGGAGTIACPCSNPPSGAGRGCNNSSATGGATLSAAGSASVSADTLAFTASGERPTALSILLQGNLEIPAGLVYGQGIRCAAGTLKRLYHRNASGGALTLPSSASGDPSVTARSAALGDPIGAGESRWYLVYYRDPNVLGGCPSSSTFNAGPTMRVDWRP